MRNEIVRKNLILTAVTLIVFFLVSIYISSYFNKKVIEEQLVNVSHVVKNQVEGTVSEEELKKVVNFYSSHQDWLEVSVMNSLGVILYNSAQDLEGKTVSEEDLALFDSLTGEHDVFQSGNMLYMIINVNDDIFIKTSMVLTNQTGYILNHLFIFLFLLGITFMVGYIYNANIANNVIDVFTNIKHQLKSINDYSFDYNKVESKYEEVNESLLEINETAENIVSLIKTNKQEKEKLDYLINKIQQGIFVINSDAELLISNEFANKTFNICGEGKLIDLDHYCKKTILPNLSKVLKTKKDVTFEVVDSQNDLIYSFHSYYLNTKWDIKDEGVGIVITVILDVTADRKSNELKNEFITNAAHELKTPLTSIIGYAELLTHDLVKDQQQANSYYKKIYDESISMNLTVENLLFLINLETIENINLDEVVNLRGIINNSIIKYGINIKYKKVEIIEKYGDSFVKGNKLLLSYLVNNLLENAINYNNEGGFIELETKEDENYIYLSVNDSGKGIDKKNLNKIFDKFYRITEERVRNPGSTGIGLSIVARIVNIHDATINVESEVNKGTNFKIKFNKYKGDKDAK